MGIFRENWKNPCCVVLCGEGEGIDEGFIKEGLREEKCSGNKTVEVQKLNDE